MVSDRATHVPPPNATAWNQQNRPGPSAYRGPLSSPGTAIGAGAQADSTSTPQLVPTEPVRLSASGQPLPQGNAPSSLIPTPAAPPGTASLPGEPNPPGFSGIQRVGYEESALQPPQQQQLIRGVPSEALPQADVIRNASLPGVNPVAPRPLLMAEAEVEKTPRVPQESRPMASSNDEKDSPRPTAPPAPTAPTAPTASAVEEKSPPPVAPNKDEERPAPTTGGPPVRMVNSKRVVLNYELKDVGPSGVSAVELWFTRDGRTWNKDETAGRSGPPYIIEVPEEGMYGFTLVARNGVGVGKNPPMPGDLPQVWVEVDLTRPKVNLTEIKNGTGAKAREVTIAWDASDRNLSRRPITLLYSERQEGPWQPLAANIENTGKHVWTIPTTCPGSFFTRVEAVDLVGNVGVATATKPASIDMSQPSVSILGVEPGEK